MRIFGLDVHRTFAEVALLDERGVRSAGRIDLIADALHTFGRQLTLDDDVVLEAVPTGSWNGRRSSAPLAVTVAEAEGQGRWGDDLRMSFMILPRLMTQRPLVQIQPPQPGNTRGLAIRSLAPSFFVRLPAAVDRL